MLSTIGRAAVRRVVAPGPQSTNSAFRSIWHLQNVGTFHNQKISSTLQKTSFSPRRTYTTATKVAPESKTIAKTAKPKKKPAAKNAVKKAVKKVAKKKKVVKKLKPKLKSRTPKKKILTEEEAKKVVVKDLKAKALTLPKKLPHTAWTVLASEMSKANPTDPRVASGMVQASAKYKSLSPTELEHYNHTANQNKATNETTYKQWVESHTPEQIRVANLARTQLRTKDPLHTWRAIHDDRIPKRPSSPMFFFCKERYASGDLKGIALGDNARILAREWAALSPSDKKTYENQATTDRQRYAQEYKTVFHRDPNFVAKEKAT